MSWRRVAEAVLRRPRRVLGASLALLIAPLFALPSTRISYNLVHELPADSDASLGLRSLEGSFGPGQVQPLVVVARSSRSVWSDRSFRAIDQLTLNLRKVHGVAEVRSITRPSSGGVSPAQLRSLGLGELSELGRGLPRATRGLGRAVDGLVQIRAGLAAILAGVPGQRAGIDQALAGIEAMRQGLARIRPGLAEIEGGIEEVERGLRQLARGIVRPALRNLERAWDDLRQASIARNDPQYPDLVRHVGEALGLVSGRCPDTTGIGPQPQDCPAGRRIDPEYDGLGPTLRQAARGLDQAGDGLRAIRLGLGAIDGGLGRLAAGLAEGRPQLSVLEDGVIRMVDSLDRIVPGLRTLRRELAAGQSLIEESGLLSEPEDKAAITASVASAFPKLRRQLSFFVGDRDRATRLLVVLDRQGYDPRSLDASREVRDVTELSLRDTPFQDGGVLVTGAAPFFADIESISEADLATIVWAVIVGVFLVLVLLLRSLVAPIYLVLTVLLSFGATLGLSVVVFQGILGEPGLVWWLPIFLFVILVALGADYNIFLMGRIREEAGRLDTRTAVSRGLEATGHVITSAGLILAGTFAALLAAPLGGMVQMGFAATTGILMDTFIVRSLLVPSIAVLSGSASWWPSARSRRP